MFDFIKLKEMAKQRANLKVLNEIQQNLKYNWSNETFKINKHIQVQEIKREAEQNVVFYRELAKKALSSGKLITSNAQNRKLVESLESYFNEYHSAIYIVAFTSLLELLLFKNLEPQFISKVRESLIEDSYNYRQLYTNAYTIIEKRTRTSLESQMTEGFASANKLAGKALSKVPLLSKSQIDEKLIEGGEKIANYNLDANKKRLAIFSKHREVGSKAFIDSIGYLEQTYSKDITLIINNETVYFE